MTYLNSMNLSESYKKRLKFLSGLIEESSNKNEYEYQLRDIGGDVFYKRKKGEKKWLFTDEVDFYKNSKKGNIVKWEKSEKPKKNETSQNLNYKKDILKIYKSYYENLSPSDFKIKIDGDSIIIKIK
jgi:hypothetical protein